MAEDSGDFGKRVNVGAQALAAVLVVGGIGGVLWAQNTFQGGAYEAAPATCSDSRTGAPSKYVSGPELCEALNRPDLPTLLGTPKERAYTAVGGDSTVTFAGGTKTATPEATVGLETYSVQLSALDNGLSVARSVRLMGDGAEPKSVLGHPAALYSDRTIALSFGGDRSEAGQGGVARCLMVAGDEKDGGASYELVIWRQDGVTPDDAALFRVAEQVLPTVPGWTGS
ncbi:hypothetical protein QFZ75_000565 [Streptomyces sp. V3I8]|uniref:DUF6215 domain-containing protein n=1 Tax=Streptomyces sp. V3I8 TaxID=3042279 RepID=UPI0027899A82|nr:DUF6215 domain-containing protein [Streptomyces sp. V3I8]MDQ1034149.1 hypothetical protein [Streptomyces sp. V3I8]